MANICRTRTATIGSNKSVDNIIDAGIDTRPIKGDAKNGDAIAKGVTINGLVVLT
jgi:hypothetical protein